MGGVKAREEGGPGCGWGRSQSVGEGGMFKGVGEGGGGSRVLGRPKRGNDPGCRRKVEERGFWGA